MSEFNKYGDADLGALRRLCDELPTGRIALVRRLWPEISVALDAGHSLIVVHRKLSEGGFELPYRTFVWCVNRIRLEQARTVPLRLRGRRAAEQTHPPDQRQAERDPLANLRKYGTDKLPRFDFNSIPDPEKLF
jgi:hypothetical protein